MGPFRFSTSLRYACTADVEKDRCDSDSDFNGLSFLSKKSVGPDRPGFFSPIKLTGA
jgi:hypothetical protein